MQICTLGMRGNFDKNLGQGVQIYNYQIWNNLKRIVRPPSNVEKVELGFGESPITRKISFTIAEMLYSFSKYDIIHMPSPVMFNPRTKGSTVTTLHELFLIEKDHPLASNAPSPSLNVQTLPSSFIDARIRMQIMESNYLLPNSTQTFLEAKKAGYPKDRMFMINHAIDDKFSRSSRKPRKHSRFTVGYLGSMHARKNVQFAIKAFKSFKAKSAKFNIWGKIRPEYKQLLQMAADDRRITFMGFAPEETKADIYLGFDVFLFPSLYEGFGVEILEAQALGIPVIVCKSGSIPKETRKYCFEAEDEDHMAQIIENIMENGYSRSRRDSAARYARSFNWEKCAAETMNAYREILKREG